MTWYMTWHAQIDDFSLVSFIPLNITKEKSIQV
jgi:hypothetical protein